MNKILVLAVSLLVFNSCKTSYTGFQAYKADANAIKSFNGSNVKMLSASVNMLESDMVIAENSNDLKLDLLTEKLHFIEKSGKEEIRKNDVLKSKTKKFTLKEKVVNKVIQKQLRKSNTNYNKPNEFNNLDSKLKIGLILLAIAVGLSILGLGTLAGLAGLIGLIFLIIGLLNTYN